MVTLETARPAAGVDARGVRFGQGATGVLSLLAFVLGAPAAPLVVALALVLAAGAFLGSKANLWNVLYASAVKPALKLGPPKKLKDAAPPRFANAIGAIFLGAAGVLLYAAPDLALAGLGLGWVLTLIVSALALLAAATDICVGCEMYVLLQKLRGPKTTQG